MQIAHTWHKLNLHRHKIIVLLVLGAMAFPAKAQHEVSENLTDYDAEWIHYGFLIGIHNSKYRTQYSDLYATDALDTLHSIVPEALPGWKVGFVVDMYLLKYLNFRVLPTVGFYEQNVHYRFTDNTTLSLIHI